MKPSSIPTTLNETFSGACMAILLGASSPRTREKYEVMSVMTTTEKPLITPAGIPLRTDIFPIAPESISTNVCDADAEVRKPARVTPI